MKFLLTLWLSKVIALGVSLIDRQRGSNYSGMIATKLMPDFVAHFKGIDYDKVILITGTNGKSTTTNLVGHSLKSAGKTVASNVEGANMMGGVATTLIKNSSLSGKLNKEFLVLEIDERSLPGIRKVLPARHMGITNLQKDQVQRNGDPDFIFRKFESAIGKDMTLYLNNEEPRSKALASCAGNACFFSVAPNQRTYIRNDFYTVTMACPKCGHPIAYHRYNLANIGTFSCTHCDHRSGDHPDVEITAVDYAGKTMECGGLTWPITYNNPFYIYNYAMDIAICRHFGIPDEEIRKSFQSFDNPATHELVFSYHGKQVHYLQAKQENPEALQSALDIVAGDKRPKSLFMGMYTVEDFLPYYSNTFYFFDCDFRPVVESGVAQYVAFSTPVCQNLASRMIFDGAPEETVTVLNTGDVDTVLQQVTAAPTEHVYILTNIKSFKQFKQQLSQGGNGNG